LAAELVFLIGKQVFDIDEALAAQYVTNQIYFLLRAIITESMVVI